MLVMLISVVVVVVKIKMIEKNQELVLLILLGLDASGYTFNKWQLFSTGNLLGILLIYCMCSDIDDESKVNLMVQMVLIH